MEINGITGTVLLIHYGKWKRNGEIYNSNRNEMGITIRSLRFRFMVLGRAKQQNRVQAITQLSTT